MPILSTALSLRGISEGGLSAPEPEDDIHLLLHLEELLLGLPILPTALFLRGVPGSVILIGLSAPEPEDGLRLLLRLEELLLGVPILSTALSLRGTYGGVHDSVHSSFRIRKSGRSGGTR